MLREAIAAFPFDAELLTNLGMVLLIQGKAAEALEAADQASTISPSDEWPHRVASYVVRRSGRRSEALQRAEGASRRSGSSSRPDDLVFEVLHQRGISVLGQHGDRLLAINPRTWNSKAIEEFIAATGRPLESRADPMSAQAAAPEFPGMHIQTHSVAIAALMVIGCLAVAVMGSILWFGVWKV